MSFRPLAPLPQSSGGRPICASACALTALSRSSRRRRIPAWRTPPAARGGASANALRGRLRPCRGSDGSRQLAQQAGHLERDQRALLALVDFTDAGAAFGVFLFVDREHAVGARHAVNERNAQQRTDDRPEVQLGANTDTSTWPSSH